MTPSFAVVPIGPTGVKTLEKHFHGVERNTGELVYGSPSTRGLVTTDPPLRKDALARLKGVDVHARDWFMGNNRLTLNDVIDFSNHGGGRVLAKAYPWLPEVPVGSQDSWEQDPATRGVFVKYRPTWAAKNVPGYISVMRNFDWDSTDPRNKNIVWSIILHEMVHAIQSMDPAMLPKTRFKEDYWSKLSERQSFATEATADSAGKITRHSAEDYGRRVARDAHDLGNPNVLNAVPPLIRIEKPATNSEPPPVVEVPLQPFEPPPEPVPLNETRQDSKGGDAGEGSTVPVPESGTPVRQGGPRIVINPSVFRDDKDALCVAFNEAFRIVMESMEFNPVSEPTEEQRRFFADTAYSQDENQMRRTILARIATFDTSIKDPTDEQIEETVEFLQSVLEAEIPQTEFEQNAVLRILDTLRQVRSRGVHVNDSSSEASASMPPPSLT